MAGPIRVGVIGAHVGGENAAGSWGARAHIPALHTLPGFTPFGVANQSLASAEAAAKAFGVTRAYANPAALIADPEIDLVSVCVRVPYHFDLVMAAIGAGKQVYCEWPLGRDTEEAVAMAAAARASGKQHFIGLQGRQSPAIAFVRDLIRAGEIGEVRAVSFEHSVPWPANTSAGSAYLQLRETGANYFTIPGGHSIDVVTHLLGDFTNLAAFTHISQPNITITDGASPIQRTAPDQIALIGTLEGGVTATLRFQGGSRHGGGIRIEINGEKGDLRIAPPSPSANMIQIAELAVHRTTARSEWEELPIPDHYYDVPETLRSGPPLNVALGYRAVERAMAGEAGACPDFADAVKLHRLLDRIDQDAATRR